MNKFLSIIKEAKLRYKLFAIFFIIALFFKWQFSSAYFEAADAYIVILAHVGSFIANVFGGISHVSINNDIVFGNGSLLPIDTRFFSVKLVVGLLIAIVILAKEYQIRWVLPAFVAWIIGINVLRTGIVAILLSHGVSLLHFDYHALYMLALCAFMYLFFWESLFGKLSDEGNKIVIITRKILFAITILYFLKLIFNFIAPEKEVVADFLSNIILSVSVSILNFLEYSVNLDGRVLSNDINYIGMGTPCIGINVMLVFMLVIYLSDLSLNIKNISFTLIGIATIIMLNAIRVTLLFVNVVEYGFDPEVLRKQHDTYNLIIYGCVLAIWYVWFNLTGTTDYTEDLEED
ncbi:archaeosortase/exosortase family protein [Bacteroidales bacterium]|nr:archaeosortase/exosortase family protein [Bacteroidales bacterium]